MAPRLLLAVKHVQDSPPRDSELAPGPTDASTLASSGHRVAPQRKSHRGRWTTG